MGQSGADFGAVSTDGLMIRARRLDPRISGGRKGTRIRW
jgi:hypothetical protein